MGRHRQIQQAGALVALLCFPCTALAQDPLPLRLIPEYTGCEVKGIRYACYTDQQMLELYTLETEARGWHQKSQQYLDLSIVQEEHINTLRAEIAQYALMQERSLAHMKDLENKLFDFIEINAELESEIEDPPGWPMWIGGGLAIFGLGAFAVSLFKAP